MKKLSVFLSALMAFTMLMTGCSASKKAEPTPAPTQAQVQDTQKLDELTQNKRHITIEMEDGKKINAEIYPDLAPITVENFIKLVEEHFYDGLIFHRVIPGFMIQGGGFDAALNQKESESIKGEFSSNGVENPLPHTRGVLSMARTNEPDSASSQFFIMHEDGNFLDGEYAAFGKVTDEESLAVVDEIANVKTTTVSSKQMENVPVKTVAIKTITLND